MTTSREELRASSWAHYDPGSRNPRRPMTTRRDFIRNSAGAMAGSGRVGCDPLAARDAQAQASGAGRRREVVVSGRRVKTVDVHAHCAVPEAMALMGLKAEPQTLIMGQDRIRAMDEQGIDVEALSINPYWYKAERDLASALIRIQNEKLAELCASRPERFVAFATVALQHPDLAAEQLEEGVKKLGLRGGSIGANVAGEELSDPRFHPFWAKAEQLGCLIFIHPQGGSAGFEQRLKGNGGLSNVIGNPLDTTIALSHLIFEGTLDRFPGLKICAAHGGGFLPSYASRSDAVITTFPNRVGPLPKKKPTEYIRGGQLYFDSIMFTGEGMRHLIAEAGIDHVVLGTDYPFPWNTAPVDHIMEIPGLSDADRTKILGGTACQLLGIKA